MNKVSIIAVAIACFGTVACGDMGSSRTAPASHTYPAAASGPQYSSGMDNSMPGKQGGFNNDDINGKSRNADSTTPGTGPMNANTVVSGNVPR
jgi:hypothetical protein